MPRSAALDELPALLGEAGVEATADQLRLFRVHYELLERWNRKVNLTAIREPREILRRHFAESAFLARTLAPTGGTLVDVGSGGGFPGVPIKVLHPGTRVVLVESVQKKAAFLKELARSLGLAGLDAFAGRLETLDLAAEYLTSRGVRADRAFLAEARRIVPRGTLALLLADADARRLGAGWRLHSVPGGRGVVALCSTWNMVYPG
jgi:16S rRNA (guanine527-N7)-methyltransferase